MESLLNNQKNILFLVQSRACSANVAKAALSLTSNDVERANIFLREITNDQLSQLIDELSAYTDDIKSEILEGWYLHELNDHIQNPL